MWMESGIRNNSALVVTHALCITSVFQSLVVGRGTGIIELVRVTSVRRRPTRLSLVRRLHQVLS